MIIMLMIVMVILKLIMNAHRSGKACHIPGQLIHLITITLTITITAGSPKASNGDDNDYDDDRSPRPQHFPPS